MRITGLDEVELKRSNYAQPDRHKRLVLRRERPFIGWDGEGYNDASGRHHYMLFGSSEGDEVSGSSLTWRQCLPLLFQSPKDAHHVIFAGTYDVVMMFRTEDRDFNSALLKGRTVYSDQYRITYLKGKMLRITDRELKETRTLYDVFTFFGSSFVKACKEYLGESELLNEIESMKAERNEFTKERLDDVRRYMRQELAMLVELMTELRKRLALVNIHPQMWHGPGAVASTVLKAHGIAKRKGEYNEVVRQVAESAYYGGRFEQFQRGTYEGTVYQYDIRSAYPNAMRHLRALDETEWHYCLGSDIDALNPYGLYRIDCRRYRSEIGYLPWRSASGSIFFPNFANGWYHGIEIPSHLSGYVQEGWEPVIMGVTETPFTFVAEMYEQRAKLKAANQPHQLALKLALNSLYGKLAQSKGAKQLDTGEWRYPNFHEIIWAGWITAYTRRMISDAMHSVDPSSIIATETDSVFTKEPLPVTVGEGLGQWDCEILEGIKYIKSGVSLVKKGGTWHFKTRGFTVKRREDEVEIWSDFLASRDPELTVRQTRFGADPRIPDRYGRWYSTNHKLKLVDEMLEKRFHTGACSACPSTFGEALHKLIVPPIRYERSTPYRFVWRDAPEWLQTIELSDDYDEPILKLEYA